MKRPHAPPRTRPTLLMLALLAAYGSASAQASDADKYSLVEGSVGVGKASSTR